MKLKKNFSLTIAIGMVLYTPFLLAHSPELSSLMIYEQNGKNILVIKSSIAAFEGEIDYIYKKESYKTSQKFCELAIDHVKKNCLVIINHDTIKYNNLQVRLGHETTLFAELDKVPQEINSFFVKNNIFKDMPYNLCELILSVRGIEQKQIILDNKNNHEVNLRVKDNTWIVDETGKSIFSKNNLFLWGSILTAFCITILLFMKNLHLEGGKN